MSDEIVAKRFGRLIRIAEYPLRAADIFVKIAKIIKW